MSLLAFGAKCVLENAEQTSPSWNRQDHGSQLAQQFLPLLDCSLALIGGDGVQDFKHVSLGEMGAAQAWILCPGAIPGRPCVLIMWHLP
jgi:hypothetical protein